MNNDGYDGPGYKPDGGYESGFDYIARTQGDRPLIYPKSKEPGYNNSEHYYNELGDRQPTISGQSTLVRTETPDGPGYKPDGGYESGFDYIARTQGDRPLIYPESKEPGYESGFDYIARTQGDRPLIYPKSKEPGYESGFDYDARENANRTTPLWGSKINGVNVTTLISNGAISAETMQEDDFKTVYTEIMYGYTNDKNMLAAEIELIMSKKDLIRDMLINQYNLAVEELSREKKGFYNQDMVNRKFQFLTTICILEGKGFDMNSLEFSIGGRKIDFVQLIDSFQRQCRINSPVIPMSQSPFWFENNESNDYHFVDNKDPELVVNYLIKKEYIKNPDRFLEEWIVARKESRVPENQNKPFDIYMTEKYRINIKTFGDELNAYVESRVKQIITGFENAKNEKTV